MLAVKTDSRTASFVACTVDLVGALPPSDCHQSAAMKQTRPAELFERAIKSPQVAKDYAGITLCCPCGQVEPGGVVTSDAVHADVIERITQGVRQAGLTPHGIFESPVRGAVGKNKEFFIHATYEGQPALTPGQQDSSVLDP